MKITACMIVKNEQEFLPRCLESIRELVDEIVVVDTGSIDDTVRIAESFGAKVFHHPWNDSFAEARNHSLSHVDGDWIIQIDADEKFVPAQGADLSKDLIKAHLDSVEQDVNAVALQLVDIQQGKPVMRTQAVRIFRVGKVQYKNRVHNAPVYDGFVALLSVGMLEHYGYDLAPEKMRAKFERTHALLMRQLSEEPENTKILYYLCQLHGMAGNREECLRWGREYLNEAVERDQQYDQTVLYTLGKTLVDMGRHEEALDCVYRGLADIPNDPDLGLVLSDIGSMTKNPRMLANGCRAYLDGVTALAQSPTAFGGRFLFSIREDILAVQLFRLFSTSLQEALFSLEKLRPYLGGNDTIKAETEELVRMFQTSVLGQNLETSPTAKPDSPFKIVHEPHGKATVGRNCHIKNSAFIDVTGGVTIGDNVIISDNVHVHTHDHRIDRDEPINDQTDKYGVIASSLVIEDDVWLGAGCQVLNSVTRIPRGTVVGAGAILTKNPKCEFGIFVGNPAVMVNKRTRRQAEAA